MKKKVVKIKEKKNNGLRDFLSVPQHKKNKINYLKGKR